MLDDALELPDDPSVLKDLVAALASELKSHDLLIEQLKHQLAGLRRHRFGARSETLDQLELTLEEAEIARAVETPVELAPRPVDEKRKPKRLPLPDHLPCNKTVLSTGAACPRAAVRDCHVSVLRARRRGPAPSA
jgi:transposase